LPSGLKAMRVTLRVCPSKVRIRWPVSASQSLIVLSVLADAIVLPSELKATQLIPSE